MLKKNMVTTDQRQNLWRNHTSANHPNNRTIGKPPWFGAFDVLSPIVLVGCSSVILNWTSRWWPQWIDMGKGPSSLSHHHHHHHHHHLLLHHHHHHHHHHQHSYISCLYIYIYIIYIYIGPLFLSIGMGSHVSNLIIPSSLIGETWWTFELGDGIFAHKKV